jgi:hypothetical protein
MKDFTPAQAARWVAQQLASTTRRGPAAVRERIKSEESFVKRYAELGLPDDLPISSGAHKTLIEELKKLQ